MFSFRRGISSAARTNPWVGKAARESLKQNNNAASSRFYSQTKTFGSEASPPHVATIEDAKKMPRHYNEMPGSLILSMACSGKFGDMCCGRKYIC